jgi:hypothetical protein
MNDRMEIKGFQQGRPASPGVTRKNPWPFGEKQGS